jgi:putative membrane protein
VQGDVWDAQKDMLADTLGALAAITLFWLVRPDRR